ncbi:hypothetical protein WA026_018378 [Henosepilachna vigintioctopunctata]|uniref:Uncharacterized protein n=1 Tax=Henosepilachna vigintioctopunctata TaxID=420089 RepID=A0AAW1VGI6_9CUCU
MPCADTLCKSDIIALSRKLGDSVHQLDAFRFLRRHKKKKEERNRHGLFESLFNSLSTFLWPVATDFSSAPARSWIEATFTKRECIKYVPHPKYENR